MVSAVDDAAGSFALPGVGPLTGARIERAVAPRSSAALVSRQQWERRFRTRLRVSDTAVVVFSCVVASALPLLIGTEPASLGHVGSLIVATAIAIALWLMLLSILSTRDTAILGSGAVEYTRVAHATGLAFGALAILEVVTDGDGTRMLLMIALPAGLAILVLERWMNRRWLMTERSAGRYSSRTVVVGSRDDVEYAVRALTSGAYLGYRVVGAALFDEEIAQLRVDDADYPVVGGAEASQRAASLLSADTIVVASQPAGDPTFIKRLAWDLEGSAAELVLTSRIADVAGPRMTLSPVEGLPLLHVAIPTFEGGAYVMKRALDIAVSSAALVLFAPIAAIIALAIKIDDGGPVLFQQARIGRDGHEFKMVKFRSMRVDAEAQLAFLAASNDGAGPLFKMKHDPRVTPVGRLLRKYSLDEVPQFWNVLVGDMSVVGPRPPLPSEVTAYDGSVYRRLYIKPGITGPWQVGGRSDLSWEESIRLDLRYVENWSVMSDLVLMWRTAKVMIRPDGAY